MSDFPLRFYVVEWRPIIFGVSSTVLIFLAFSLAFIIRYWKKYEKYEIVLYFLFLSAAFSSARHLPFLIILAVILIDKGIRQFIVEIGNSPKKLRRFYLFFSSLLVLISTVAAVQMKADYRGAEVYSENSFYPKKAVNFISVNLPRGQVFGSYDWGGYLIWKLPEKKVFIDGRMASWKQKSNKLESGYAFGEQTNLLQVRLPLVKVFNKYGIDMVLLPRVWITNQSDKTTWEIATKFVRELEKNSFRKIYQDQTALIFERNF